MVRTARTPSPPSRPGEDTEPLTQSRYDRALYRRFTEESGRFRIGAAEELVEPVTNQLWRGLLLMVIAEDYVSATGRYTVIASDDDSDARAAVEKVRSWMVPHAAARLRFVSLEKIVEGADRIADRRLNLWSSAFRERYLPALSSFENVHRDP